MNNLDEFTEAYITCALWLADDNPGQGEWTPHGSYIMKNIDQHRLNKMIEECRTFQQENADDLATLNDDNHAGHDFYLTRNGHGSGFWSRGLGDMGLRLTKASDSYGESQLYIGDDGKLYL